MSQLRVEKVKEFLKQEISKIILTELKDPRIGFATVTRVELSGDLRNAKVFISLMGSDDQKAATWEGLKSALGYLRTEIAKRVQLRFAPEITLHLDTSMDHSVRIQELLRQINKENTKGEGSQDEFGASGRRKDY